MYSLGGRMAQFSVQHFLRQPSVVLLDACKKDDLLKLAAHFGIPILRFERKVVIRMVVYKKSVAVEILKHEEVPDSVEPTAAA